MKPSGFGELGEKGIPHIVLPLPCGTEGGGGVVTPNGICIGSVCLISRFPLSLTTLQV